MTRALASLLALLAALVFMNGIVAGFVQCAAAQTCPKGSDQ